MTNVLLRSVWTRIFGVPILSTGNLCPSGVSLLYGRSGGRQEAWGRRRSLSRGVRPSMMSHKGIIRLECSLTLRYVVDSWPTFRSFYPTFYSYELMHRSWLKVCQWGRPLRGPRKWHTACVCVQFASGIRKLVRQTTSFLVLLSQSVTNCSS